MLPWFPPFQTLTSGRGSSGLAGAAGGWGLDPKDSKPDTPGPANWNVDVFVQVIRDLAPHLNWREVVSELDHPGFSILSKAGLRILVQGLFRGLQDVFPVDQIYKPWKNSEGQVTVSAMAVIELELCQ